jgi:hypothetical protein
VSHKDGNTKHAQDYRDDFNHFDAPLLLVRLIADPVFSIFRAGKGPSIKLSWAKCTMVGGERIETGSGTGSGWRHIAGG